MTAQPIRLSSERLFDTVGQRAVFFHIDSCREIRIIIPVRVFVKFVEISFALLAFWFDALRSSEAISSSRCIRVTFRCV